MILIYDVGSMPVPPPLPREVMIHVAELSQHLSNNALHRHGKSSRCRSRPHAPRTVDGSPELVLCDPPDVAHHHRHASAVVPT